MFSKSIIKGLIFGLLLVLPLSACAQVATLEMLATRSPDAERVSATVTPLASVSSATLAASPTDLPSDTPTARPTDTSTISPSATQTLSATPIIAPTATLSPTLTAAPLGVRVFMPAETTSLSVKGGVSGGGRVNYLLKAAADQVMMVTLQSAKPDLALEIRTPQGEALVNSSAHATFWQGSLPASGDYVITVVATGESAEYYVDVTIPLRVIFKPGAISSLTNGFVPARGVTTYLLRAAQGQTLTVTIYSPRNNVFLTIYGLDDGQPYVRSVSGQTTFNFELPSTQDYMIQCVSGTDIAENYQIEFIVR